MKKILIGTHNRGKFKEISYLISRKFRKISPLILKIPSPEETGKTFQQNAKLKVNFFSKFVNYPVISDDSGLCIKSLNNKPGIYSARLAKQQGSFNKGMKYILKKMRNKKDRSAVFVCCLSYKQPKKNSITVVGKINGKISNQIIGTKGFGYDPIFIPKNSNITFGQMPITKKKLIDHRFVAFKKLKKKIKIL